MRSRLRNKLSDLAAVLGIVMGIPAIAGFMLAVEDGGEEDEAKKAADAAAAAEAAKKAEDEAKKKAEPVTFTPEQQAHIDGLIAKQHGKAKSAAEADFKKWLDQQALGETDRLKAEKADADKAVADAKAEVLAGKVETTAERLALAAGCKPDRVPKLMRLLGDLSGMLDDLTTDGKPDSDAIKALVEKELADTPELKGTAAATGASGGDGFNGNGDTKVWTRAEIAKLTPAEFEQHEAAIMKQMQGAGIN